MKIRFFYANAGENARLLIGARSQAPEQKQKGDAAYRALFHYVEDATDIYPLNSWKLGIEGCK